MGMLMHLSLQKIREEEAKEKAEKPVEVPNEEPKPEAEPVKRIGGRRKTK